MRTAKHAISQLNHCPAVNAAAFPCQHVIAAYARLTKHCHSESARQDGAGRALFLRCVTFSISVFFVICPATSTGVEAFAGLGLVPWLQMVAPGGRSCSLLLHKFGESDQCVINLLHDDTDATKSLFLAYCRPSSKWSGAQKLNLCTSDTLKCSLERCDNTGRTLCKTLVLFAIPLHRSWIFQMHCMYGQQLKSWQTLPAHDEFY